MNYQHIFTFLTFGFGVLTFFSAALVINEDSLKWRWILVALIVLTLTCGSLSAGL